MKTHGIIYIKNEKMKNTRNHIIKQQYKNQFDLKYACRYIQTKSFITYFIKILFTNRQKCVLNNY